MTTEIIRIFVGSSAKFADAEIALANSLKRNSHSPYELSFMRPEDLRISSTGCTGFTNLRYAVPELAGYAGYAIYLDADMIVLSDIGELYEYREPGRWVTIEDGSTEVSVISCGAHRNLPSIRNLKSFRKSDLNKLIRTKAKIPTSWNVEDNVIPGMDLLHFTDLKCQPWSSSQSYPHPVPEAVKMYEYYRYGAF